MEWEKQGEFALGSAEGYVISATRIDTTVVNGKRRGGTWVYCAFGPERSHEELKTLMRVQYAIGEAVPLQRDQLGCYRGDGAIESAKAACEAHREEMSMREVVNA